MTALSQDKLKMLTDGLRQEYPVAENAVIYGGGGVCLDWAGYAIAAVDAVAAVPVGISDEPKVDNTGGANGAKTVVVRRTGVVKVAAASISRTMLGQPMYWVDDQTVDDATGVTNHVLAGILVGYESATSGWIALTPELHAAPYYLMVYLLSTANGRGASLIAIEDAADNFTAEDVEAALAEIMTLCATLSQLALTDDNGGARLIGVEDFAGDYAGENVEAVLAEIAANFARSADLGSDANGKGASLIAIEDDAGNFTAEDVEAALAELADSGAAYGLTDAGDRLAPNEQNVEDAIQKALRGGVITFPTFTGWTKDGEPHQVVLPALEFPFPVRLKAYYGALGTAPGGGKTFSLSINGSALGGDIAEAAVQGENEALDIAVAANTDLVVSVTETSSGAGANAMVMLRWEHDDGV